MVKYSCVVMVLVQELAKGVIETEKEGIEALHAIVGEELEKVIRLLACCKGHVIISGVGKSGNVATKIVASMSSLGVPSFFLDPSNAGHGDMGMITQDDVVIAISNSGESGELMSVINYCFDKKIPTVAITRNEKSTIAHNANYKLTIPASREAHEFNAPTTSTTQTLVLGDVLAVCSSKLKSFQKVEYAVLHPSGNLGMKISKVAGIMSHEFCTVGVDTSSIEVLERMTRNSNGFVCVVKRGRLYGMITDGDIRRFILKGEREITAARAEDICSISPKFVTEEQYIIDAVELINAHNIASVIVVNEKQEPVGFVSRVQFKI